MVVTAEISCVWNESCQLRGRTSHVFPCLLMRYCLWSCAAFCSVSFPNSEQFQQLLATGTHCCLTMRAAGCVESAQPSFLLPKQVRSERYWPGADRAFPSQALQAVVSSYFRNSTPDVYIPVTEIPDTTAQERKVLL